MASFHRRDSFLRGAGVYDVFLDINVLPKIPASISDTAYIIEQQYDGRPDLLAYEMYDNPRLWWVFALRNPDQLVDPLNDFSAGVKIYIPPKGIIEQIV
jgi:hypothetical protein